MQKFKNIRVKITKTNKSYVTFKMVVSNSILRMKRKAFMENVKKGIYEVMNPSQLPAPMQAELA